MGLPSSVLDRLPDVLGGIGKEAWMTYARATDGTSTRWSFASPANGMYLWRAVDHEAEVLDVLVQRGATSARHSG
jgi:hypothetical protein